jgi:hypothetical protein
MEQTMTMFDLASDLSLIVGGIGGRACVGIVAAIIVCFAYWLLARRDAFYLGHLKRCEEFAASFVADFRGPPLPSKRPRRSAPHAGQRNQRRRGDAAAIKPSHDI